MAHTPVCYDCECGWDGSNELTVLCPLHAATPQLLEALEAIELRLFPAGMPYSDKDRAAMRLVAFAIRAAKGE